MSIERPILFSGPMVLAILEGRKTFEIRKDDRGFKVGDGLWFREFDPGNEGYEGMDVVQPGYTGREMRHQHTINYIVKGVFGLPADVVVFGLAVCPIHSKDHGQPPCYCHEINSRNCPRHQNEHEIDHGQPAQTEKS